MEGFDDNRGQEEEHELPEQGRAEEQEEFDNDRFEETPFIEAQDPAGGSRTVDTLGTSGPSQVTEQVREAVDDGSSTSQTAQDDTSFMDRYIRHTSIPEFAEFIEDDALEYRKFLLHVERTNNGNITYDVRERGRRIAKSSSRETIAVY